MNKRDVVVFGKGRFFEKHKDFLFETYHIIAIADSDKTKQGMYGSIPVISPSEISKFEDVQVLIVKEQIDFNMVEQLRGYAVDIKRIIPFFRPGYLRHEEYEATFVVMNNGNTAVKIHIEKYGLSFYLRSKTDFVVFDEIYLDNDYRIGIPDSKAEKIAVVDIGMNVGLASLFFAKEDRVDVVYGYEPFAETFLMANDNIEANKDDIKKKIQCFNYALGEKDGEKNVKYLADEPGNMSILKDSGSDYSKEGDSKRIVEKEAGRVLKQIFEDNSDKTIIVKCDCEGSEYSIFESMKKYDLIGRASYYIIETHLGRGDEILDSLHETGFSTYAPVSREGRLGIIFASK